MQRAPGNQTYNNKYQVKIDKVLLSQVEIRKKKTISHYQLSMGENIFIKKLLNALISHTKVHMYID